MSLAKWPPRIGDDELGAGVRYGGPTQECGKPRKCEAFPRAAEGIRTLDLLHGKQSVPRRIGMNMPANRQFLGAPGAYAGFPTFTAKPRGLPDPNRTEPGTSHSAEVEKAGALGGTGRRRCCRALTCRCRRLSATPETAPFRAMRQRSFMVECIPLCWSCRETVRDLHQKTD
jgi:hypothetical protein